MKEDPILGVRLRMGTEKIGTFDTENRLKEEILIFKKTTDL
jgi:hypothetical protein